MADDPLKLFGRHLASLRKQRGWSQEKLALESGMARSYLSGIERGLRNVALVNICALADTLGVRPSEMLKFEDQTAGGTLVMEQTPAPFGPEENPAQQSTRRYMAELDGGDQDLVAAIARALARKRPGR